MREKLYGDLEAEFRAGKSYFCRPLTGIFELTYECPFDCVHCYCKGSENKKEELNLTQIKDILSQLQSLGCIRIAFSGGEPMSRKDFIDIYLFAKRKGFLIDIFTSGFNLKDEIISALKKSPPHCIEITLNAISKNTYETITHKQGSFEIVLKNINKLKRNCLPLVIKSNCLSLNKNEIIKIKSFSKELLGPDLRRFRLDPIILPRLNGDKSPCAYRLSPQDLRALFEADDDCFAEYKEALGCAPVLLRDKKFLYQCSAWRSQFFIDPFGRIKFCQFSDEFSVDLKKNSLSAYLSQISAKILNEEFKTDAKCRDCNLRQACYYCPARAYLETGGKEKPVPYFCELAGFREQDSKKLTAVLKR